MLVLTNVQTMNSLDSESSDFRSLTGVTFAYVLVLVFVSGVQYTFVHWFYWLGVSKFLMDLALSPLADSLIPVPLCLSASACVCVRLSAQGLPCLSVRLPFS
jgi:hypothetical protein